MLGVSVKIHTNVLILKYMNMKRKSAIGSLNTLWKPVWQGNEQCSENGGNNGELVLLYSVTETAIKN